MPRQEDQGLAHVGLADGFADDGHEGVFEMHVREHDDGLDRGAARCLHRLREPGPLDGRGHVLHLLSGAAVAGADDNADGLCAEAVECRGGCVEAGGAAKSVRFYAVQALDVWPASGSHYFNCVIQHQNETVLSLTPGTSQTIEQTFTLSGTSLANKDNVKYIAWVQDVVGSGPAQIHNVEYHEHGQLAPEIVSVGGPGSDYTTITEAINSIGTMSTITVNPGTYYENIDLQGKVLGSSAEKSW